MCRMYVPVTVNILYRFARNQMFHIDEDPMAKEEEEDLFHFVAYVPWKGRIYELDGLKEGPVCHGTHGRGVVLASSAFHRQLPG